MLDGSPVESNAQATSKSEPTSSTQVGDGGELQVGDNIESRSSLESRTEAENVEGGRIGATATGGKFIGATTVDEGEGPKTQEAESNSRASAASATGLQENEELTEKNHDGGVKRGGGSTGERDDIDMQDVETGGKEQRVDVTMGDVNSDKSAIEPDAPVNTHVTINVTKFGDTTSTHSTSTATTTSHAITASQTATTTRAAANASQDTTATSQAVGHPGTGGSAIASTSTNGVFGASLSALTTPVASDVGCPQWLQNMLEYLRQSSTKPSWQDLVTELVAHEKASRVSGVSQPLYCNKGLLMNFGRKCPPPFVLLRSRPGSKDIKRTFP